jgi:hypothetical protein
VRSAVVKVLIFTPFKVGSTTLFHHLRDLPGFTGCWCHSVRGRDFRENFVVKSHYRSIVALCQKHQLHWDVIFMLIRKPTEIYPSAYFQDITSPKYPYFFGNRREVLSAGPLRLMEHFLSHAWEKSKNCNYELFRDRILEYAGIDIFDGATDPATGFHIYEGTSVLTGKPVRVCTVRIDQLQQAVLERIYSQLGLPFNPRLRRSNQARQKWYAELYSEFKELLPAEFYAKYRERDERITNLFWGQPATTGAATNIPSPVS